MELVFNILPYKSKRRKKMENMGIFSIIINDKNY